MLQDCFNRCICSFREYGEINNNFHQYVSAENSNWKMGFNRRGEAISFNKYKSKKFFHFATIDLTNDYEMSSNYLKVINENACNKIESNWEKTGEEVFRKEFQDSSLECRYQSLFHPDFDNKLLSISSIKDHKRSLTENTVYKDQNLVLHLSTTIAQKSNKQKSRKTQYHRRMCRITPYDILKVRHLKNKRRSC